MKKFLIYLILLLAACTRLIALDNFPAGINADEAAIGYNAWSLVETGMDEHSDSWPLVFRSFDDYKPPVYFYLVLPFVKFFGLNIWSVRLPSAFLGVGSVYLIYLLTKKILSDKKSLLPEISALMLAISPWHLQFSRGGWEVNVSTFFILLSLIFLIKSFDRPKNIFIFSISTVLALYTYHSARIILPVLVVATCIIYWQETTKLFTRNSLKHLVPAAILGIALLLPLATQLLSKEGQSRFSGVSVFSDEGPVWQALELRRQHDGENRYVISLHNRYVTYSLRLVKNYLSHFSPRFLFVNGDEIARSKVPEVGQTYYFLVPFVLIGFMTLLKLDTKGKKLVLLWFATAPIAASLTFQSPHALRAQNMVIPLSIITAMGIATAFEYLGKIKPKIFLPLVATSFSLLLTYEFARYLHQYYVHYPKELPFAWQYGFDRIAQYSQENYDKYDKIIISDRYDQPYIIMAFYLKYPPAQMQKEIVMTPRDKFGFSTVRNLGKYEFRRINYQEDSKLPRTLIMAADEEVDDSKVIHIINDPAGKPMYKFLSTD